MTIREELLDARYDFWLDLYGVPWRTRRELRRELRANVTEAAAGRGWRPAVDSLGNLRLLARENARAVRDPHRPAWNSGAVAATATFSLVVLLAVLASSAFTDGALAAGIAGGQTVSGPITLLPGVRASAEDRSAGFIMGLSISPWLLLGLPALAFALASRLWRLLWPARPAVA